LYVKYTIKKTKRLPSYYLVDALTGSLG